MGCKSWQVTMPIHVTSHNTGVLFAVGNAMFATILLVAPLYCHPPLQFWIVPYRMKGIRWSGHHLRNMMSTLCSDMQRLHALFILEHTTDRKLIEACIHVSTEYCKVGHEAISLYLLEVKIRTFGVTIHIIIRFGKMFPTFKCCDIRVSMAMFTLLSGISRGICITFGKISSGICMMSNCPHDCLVTEFTN